MITKSMVSIGTTDYSLLGKIFEFMLSESHENNEYLQIESMTIEPVNSNQYHYEASMLIKESYGQRRKENI